MKKLLLLSALSIMAVSGAVSGAVSAQTNTTTSAGAAANVTNAPATAIPEKVERKSLTKEERSAKRREIKDFKDSFKAAASEDEKKKIMDNYKAKHPESANKFEEYEKLTPEQKEAKKAEMKAARARNNDERERNFSNKFANSSTAEKTEICAKLKERCTDGKKNSCKRVEEKCGQ